MKTLDVSFGSIISRDFSFQHMSFIAQLRLNPRDLKFIANNCTSIF